MRHIRRYNESFDDGVVKMSEEEYYEFIEDHHVEDFSKYEISILKKEFVDWERFGISYTINGGVVMFEFGGRIFGTSAMVTKLDDGWYMINTIARDAKTFAERNNRTYESYRKFYKCDQFSGVLKFLDDNLWHTLDRASRLKGSINESSSVLKINWVKWNKANEMKYDSIPLSHDEIEILNKLSENHKDKFVFIIREDSFEIREEPEDRFGYRWIIYKLPNSFLKLNIQILDGRDGGGSRFYEYHTTDIKEFFSNFKYNEDYGVE